MIRIGRRPRVYVHARCARWKAERATQGNCLLNIRFLGQPRFEHNGTPLKFSAPPKTLPLFAYLLLNRRSLLRRESVAFALWPDDTEDAARSNLRRHLNYLKNALPPGAGGEPWFLSDADTVQWNLKADYVFDVDEFERSVGGLPDLARAADVYTGDLLETLYDDWLFSPRERLRGMYLECLNHLLLDSRSRRHFTRAIGYAQRIMSAEPWRENTLRELLSVRYEAGDRAGALRDFEDFQSRLRAEMGIDPMPETLSLRNVILRNGVLAQSSLSAHDSSEPERHSPLLPFTGRRSEFEQLDSLWSRAARGRGTAVLVGGEAGIGKSRLASELALRAAAQGGRVLAGNTLFPESTPYEPIAQALRSASPPLSSVGVEAARLSAIAQIVPELRASSAGIPPLPELDPAREQSRLFEAIAACLNSFAKPRPVLLILEDLHWASSATMAAFEYLARNAGSMHLLILATFREEEAGFGALQESRRRLRREGLVNNVSLRPLREDAIREMLEGIPQFERLSPDAVSDVLSRTQGNPLFLAEIIRDIVESGGVTAAIVPSGLAATISARIARLPQRAQFLARVASVAGTVFDVDVVSEVSGWPEQDVGDALEDLVRSHVVRETGSGRAFDYAFSHQLVQSAIYGGTDDATRARWHRRTAHALERIHAARIDELCSVVARHFDRAGDGERASEYYLRAARNAAALFANEQVLIMARRALELMPADSVRFDLFALCESVHSLQGDRAAQAAALDEMERLSEGSSGPQFCECLLRRALLHRTLGERAQELAAIQGLETHSARLNDPGWTARTLHARAAYETNTGELEDARKSLAAAVSGFEKAANARGEVECLCLLAYIDVFQSKSQQSEAAFARAQDVARSSGNQSLLAQTYLMASTAANIVMDYQQVKPFAKRAFDLYVTIGDREGEADSSARLGIAAGRAFDINASREWFGHARELYTALGKRQGLGSVAINYGMMEFSVGRVDCACEQFYTAVGIFSDLGDVRGLTVSAINLGMIHYHQGRYEEARQNAAQALTLARKLGSEPLQAAALGNLGAAERELGDFRASCEHLGTAIALRRKTGIADATLDVAELVITHTRLGNTGEALRLADELMELDPAQYAMTWAPQTVPIAAAQAYRAARKRAEAKKAMDLARTLFGQRIAGLPDAEGRAIYENIAFNRELRAPARTHPDVS